mgnify:CR=1 FL=1
MNAVRPTGYVERLSRRVIGGWAFDAANPSRPAIVHLVLDGRVISMAPANIGRKDLATLGIGRNNMAFELPVPAGTPIDLKRLQISVAGGPHPLPVAADGGVYEGVLEQVEDFTASGWAWRVASSERVRLVLRHGSDEIAEFVADEYREDLKQADLGDGRHGYRFDFRRYSRGHINPRNVSVAVQGTGERLLDLRATLPREARTSQAELRPTKPRPVLGVHRRRRAAEAVAEAEQAAAAVEGPALSSETVRAISEAMNLSEKGWG